ncbi:Os02g0536601, partial [Oryza sativa Japonica Group]
IRSFPLSSPPLLVAVHFASAASSSGKGGKGIWVWGAVSTSNDAHNMAPCLVALPKVAEGRVPLGENARLAWGTAQMQKLMAVCEGTGRRHPLLMA